MFSADLLRGKKANVSIYENSIIIKQDNLKYVFIAESDNYILDIDPPGVKGCNQIVDNFGRSMTTDESVFENDIFYMFKDVSIDMKEDETKKEPCFSRVTFSLITSKNEACDISLSSSKILVDIIEIHDYTLLIGKEVLLKLSNNHLTVETFGEKWSFLAQPDNYVVRIVSDLEKECSETDGILKSNGLFDRGVRCTIMDFQYFDDMLGETSIKFNLFFTNLSLEFLTEDNRIHCLEIDTGKMKVDCIT